MNKEEIKKILPHREPMLLIDEVELIDGKAFGKCHIRGDEYFLQGHFPGNPIVPGVIQCEMLAQSACVLLADGASEGMTPVFTSLGSGEVPRHGEARRYAGDRVRACAPARHVLFCKGYGPRKRQSLRFGRVLVCARQGVSPAERNRLCLRNCLSRTAAKSRCALLRACKEMGIRTVAVYSKADAESISTWRCGR